MTSPQVSIIVPAFNAAAFIRDALESVLAQTHTEFECIVIDDGSSDNTVQIATAIAAADARIRVNPLGANAGAASARNHGIRLSRGRFLAFLDSDDVWTPEKLSAQLPYMAATRSGFTYTAYRRMSTDGRRLTQVSTVPEVLDYRHLLGNTAIVTSTVIIDRDVIPDVIWPTGFGHEDFALWLSILRKGHHAHGLNQALTYLRQVPGSLSADKLRSLRWVWRIYRRHQGLGRILSTWYLTNYVVRAWVKRQKLDFVHIPSEPKR